MADWALKYGYGGGTVAVSLSSRNVTGSPLASASLVESGEAGSNVTPCGVFRFEMETDTTVSIAAVSPYDLKSVALFTGTRTVTADGATENLNLLPGVSVVLSSSAVAGDAFEIGIGCYWDAVSSVWVRAMPLDVAFTGLTGDARSIVAENISGSVQSNCFVIVTNAMWIANGQTAIRPFQAFRQTGLLNPVAHADLLGEAVTFDDLVEGTPNTISILVDGSAIDVWDVTNDALIADGVGLKCDGSTVYRFDDTTDYRSGEFILSEDVSETDTATIYVSDGGEFVEISDTVNAYVAGTTGVYLTSSGAPEGVVSEDDTVAFNLRLSAPEAKTTAMNQRLFSVRLSSVGI